MTDDQKQPIQLAIEECAEAVLFFDKVKNSPLSQQVAVMTDHWDRIEKACRRVANLAHKSEQAIDQLGIVFTDIAIERRRQIEVEGWTPEHDDAYRKFELACAASCYAINAGYLLREALSDDSPPAWWPWPTSWWKPTTGRRDLIKALALGVAEVERLDRLEASKIKAGDA